LHRLCGVFLAGTGPEETKIEASFRDAIRIAMEQKSVSLEKRARRNLCRISSEKAKAIQQLPLYCFVDVLFVYLDNTP